MKRLKKFSEFINEDEFKFPSPTSASGAGAQLAKTLTQNLDVKEVGKNAGTDVNKIQRSAGSTSGQPWCMSFIYYIFDQFSSKMGIKNPVYKTASALDQWNKAGGKKITIAEARSDFSLVKPGQIFIATRKNGGHAGIVTSVDQNGKKFTTVEGNTAITGGGEGVSANNRSLNVNNLVGFIDYFPNRDADFDKSFVNGLKGKIRDVSQNKVERTLPGDGTIGGDPSVKDADATATSSGGILGKIISGATKFYGDGKGNFADGGSTITDKDAMTALAAYIK